MTADSEGVILDHLLHEPQALVSIKHVLHGRLVDVGLKNADCGS